MQAPSMVVSFRAVCDIVSPHSESARKGRPPHRPHVVGSSEDSRGQTWGPRTGTRVCPHKKTNFLSYRRLHLTLSSPILHLFYTPSYKLSFIHLARRPEMRYRTRLIICGIITSVLAFAANAAAFEQRVPARVTRVIDGDTFRSRPGCCRASSRRATYACGLRYARDQAH